jgi:flagellar biosynthetic protein FliP
MPPDTLSGSGRHGRPAGLRHLLRHYLEMVAAMWVGMVVLGAMVRGVLAAVGLAYAHARHPELAAVEMATTMAVGMAAWMRYRGHGWAGTLEMCGAMFAPAVILFPLLWLDAIPARSLSTLMHAVMLPLMLVVMLRRRSQSMSWTRARPRPPVGAGAVAASLAPPPQLSTPSRRVGQFLDTAPVPCRSGCKPFV